MAPKRREKQQAANDASTSASSLRQPESGAVPGSPQQWYYNDDYTDPVNFGFMFPISRDDGNTSLLDVTPMVWQSGNHPSSGNTTSSFIQSYVPKQIPEAARFVKPAEESPPSLHQHPVIAQQSLAAFNAAHREAVHRNVLLGSSLGPVVPTVSPKYAGQFVTTLLNNPPVIRSQEYRNSHPPAKLPSYCVPESKGLDEHLTGQIEQLYERVTFSEPFTSLVEAYAVNSSLKTSDNQSSFKRKEITRSPSPRPKSSSEASTFLAQPKFVSRKRRSGNVVRNPYHVIDPSLCSRCQIYSKHAGGLGLCDSCLQATNFTAWPSVSGTRRENMESLVLYLLPSHMEDCVRPMPPVTPQSRTWRLLSNTPPKTNIDFSALVFQDQFILAKEQARSTGLFAEDVGDLMDIAQKYQRSLASANIALEAACRILTACCELYKRVVSIAKPGPSGMESISVPELIESIHIARSLMFKAFQELQDFALSPSHVRGRDSWLPSFLCACMMAASAVVFLDIIVAFPSPYKEHIWGTSWHNRIAEIRHGGYGMLINVLNANTKGVNPLKIDVWSDEMVASSYSAVIPTQIAQLHAHETESHVVKWKGALVDSNTMKTKAKHERDVLLGASPSALQGLIALKGWQGRYNEHLQLGEDMFSKDLYSLALMKPVAGLWRVFEMK